MGLGLVISDLGLGVFFWGDFGFWVFDLGFRVWGDVDLGFSEAFSQDVRTSGVRFLEVSTGPCGPHA